MQTRIHLKASDPSVLQLFGVTVVLCSYCWIEGKRDVPLYDLKNKKKYIFVAYLLSVNLRL